MKLNSEQETSANSIVDFLHDPSRTLFTLAGSAGTGKTTMLREAIRRSNIPYHTITGATIAHAAKVILQASLGNSIDTFTVAQWLGMKMQYDDVGNVKFYPSVYGIKKLRNYKVGIFDEASMADDETYEFLMDEAKNFGIKLIAVGDRYQLPPVAQNHDSKFFDNIDALLTQAMRFGGHIFDLSMVYRDAIKQINEGYAVNRTVLNTSTNREDRWDSSTDTGYKFKNNVYELIEKVADEIKSNPNEMNYSRMLAFKNKTVNILNTSVREYIYGPNCHQFEVGETVISNGGFVVNNMPMIHNGMLLIIDGVKEIIGPYDIPCLSLKFKNHPEIDNLSIPVVRNTPEAKNKYEAIKNKLKSYASADSRQWVRYYRFIEEFAYFDYTSAVSLYKSQGQTLKNVYVFEGEVMDVKPLNLKQKYQALYVAMTRATDSLYIYNKNY